jgi:hypothetical protein
MCSPPGCLRYTLTCVLLQQVLRRALSGLRLQAVAAWLESHVKFRLSILLTYIFGEVTDPLEWPLVTALQDVLCGQVRHIQSLCCRQLYVLYAPATMGPGHAALLPQPSAARH